MGVLIDNLLKEFDNGNMEAVEKIVNQIIEMEDGKNEN